MQRVVQVAGCGGALKLLPGVDAEHGLDTGIGARQILPLEEDIRALPLQERPALFAQLDRHRQRNFSRRVIQFAHAFERRPIAATRIEVEPDGACQLNLRDAVIIARGDEGGLLIDQCDLCLQDIETRHGTGLETVLLIFELAFEKAH